MRANLESLCKPNSGVCIGLDPDITKMPKQYAFPDPYAIIDFMSEIIDLTSEIACAYKIQKAFFDVHEESKRMLKDTINYIRRKSDAPVIIDAKIGDIGNTMKAYLNLLFDQLDSDAITVNPYMGKDVFELAGKYKERGFFTLIRTSNEGSRRIQDHGSDPASECSPVWLHILGTVFDGYNQYHNLMPVVSGDVGEVVRMVVGDDCPILYAGAGAQGADMSEVTPLLNSQNSGVIVNSSRGILYPYSADDKDWRSKVQEKAYELSEQISLVKESARVRS
jgi:orotidine 5'-phosphate decarboxylase subfamily 2